MRNLLSNTLAKFDHVLNAKRNRLDLPEGWVTSCENCLWFMEQYNREDLYLFQHIMQGDTWHVLNYWNTKPKGSPLLPN